MVTVALKNLVLEDRADMPREAEKRKKKKRVSERSTDFPVSGTGAPNLYSTSLWRAPHEV